MIFRKIRGQKAGCGVDKTAVLFDEIHGPSQVIGLADPEFVDVVDLVFLHFLPLSSHPWLVPTVLPDAAGPAICEAFFVLS